MDLFTIFLTGLTTGGLSCLAMQGGILASAIANQKDKELETTKSNTSFDQLDWLPVLMFLGGKLISHTILGLLLGLLGSRLELSLTSKLIFQGFAAFFMFATAMNLWQVHPIFRYVVLQPPKFFTRFVRNSSKSSAVFTPLVLGFLTVLIPCGVTQSMEVLAISSANPLLGGSIMFAFVLGTSPVFGLIGVGIAKMSETWTQSFNTIAALLLIFLTISSVNGIFVVLDAPLTLQKLRNAVFDPAGVIYTQQTNSSPTVDGMQPVHIQVQSTGYVPNRIKVKSGVPVQLTLSTQDTYSCAIEFILPAFNIRTRLKPTDSQTFTFTPTKKGRYTFSCWMGMYSGSLEVI